jgi:aminoglycoside phosphotransferase (APT) family kinase protein
MDARPDLGDEIRLLASRCVGLAEALDDRHQACIHRDFYPDHVLIGEETYLIDLDLLALGDPAVDVGNFLAHVTEFAHRRTGDGHVYDVFSSRFREAYLSRAGESMRARVDAYELLSLARHVQISTLFPDRRHTTALLLEHCFEQAAKWFNSENSEVA